jgi:hypothetical protein
MLVRWQKNKTPKGGKKKMNFFSGRLCKLFDKALVCAWAYGALAMCLQNALAFN